MKLIELIDVADEAAYHVINICWTRVKSRANCSANEPMTAPGSSLEWTTWNEDADEPEAKVLASWEGESWHSLECDSRFIRPRLTSISPSVAHEHYFAIDQGKVPLG